MRTEVMEEEILDTNNTELDFKTRIITDQTEMDTQLEITIHRVTDTPTTPIPTLTTTLHTTPIPTNLLRTIMNNILQTTITHSLKAIILNPTWTRRTMTKHLTPTKDIRI